MRSKVDDKGDGVPLFIVNASTPSVSSDPMDEMEDVDEEGCIRCVVGLKKFDEDDDRRESMDEAVELIEPFDWASSTSVW